MIRMCNTCGDIVRHLAWRQMSLFETHELRYTASECGCGYTLLAVTIKELESAES